MNRDVHDKATGPAFGSAIEAWAPGRPRSRQGRSRAAAFTLYSRASRQRALMRFVLLGVACLSLMDVARAQGAAALQDCLPPREMREVVSTKNLVAPTAAVMTARRAVPNADVVRANLCRNDNALVYVIVSLRKDGRVVQVTIDAPSGKVKSVQ